MIDLKATRPIDERQYEAGSGRHDRDPGGQPPETVREIREEIRRRVEALLADLTAGRPAS